MLKHNKTWNSLVSPYSVQLDFAVASEMLTVSPAQYTNTRPFPTVLTGQLQEVLSVSLVKVSQLPLPATVVPTHINIILPSETSVAF
jgi:hypothetical protein